MTAAALILIFGERAPPVRLSLLRRTAPAENAQTGTKREGRPGEAAPKQPRLKVGGLLGLSLRKSPKYAEEAT